jgi:transcriptional regulator with XRE-family HTH domain
MTFGERLSKARKEKGLTQEGLGKGLATDGEDASKSVVLGWEKDRHFPRADQLAMICQRLDCSSDYLLFGGEATPATLSPEALALAREFDSFDESDRRHLLAMWKVMAKFAKDEKKLPPDGPEQEQVHRKFK